MKIKNVKVTTLLLGGLVVAGNLYALGIIAIQRQIYSNIPRTDEFNYITGMNDALWDIMTKYSPYAVVYGVILLLIGLTFTKYLKFAYIFPALLVIPCAYGAYMYTQDMIEVTKITQEYMTQTFDKLPEDMPMKGFFEGIKKISGSRANIYQAYGVVIFPVVISILMFLVKDKVEEEEEKKIQ